MYQTVPYITGRLLYQSEGNADTILIGTPAWYDWLEHHTAFFFADLTARFLVQKSSSSPLEWIATSMHSGKLYHVSLGPTHALTLSRLQAAAFRLEGKLAQSESTMLSPVEPATDRLAVPVNVAATSSPGVLIQTKLYRPHSSGDVIPRPRLLECMNAALNGRVTLLCAPVGSGKTTLMAGWAQTSEGTTAWLSLDEGDDEVAVFVRSLTAALQSVFPDALQATASLLTAPQFPSSDYVAALLLNELDELSDEIVLVLDDYHLIHNREVHALFERLVEHLPAQLHLVLITRSDPPLPLVKWLAHGYLNELRQADLRFTLEETEAFLTLVRGDEAARAAAAVLQEQTEGWIAVLRLAALALRSTADYSVFLKSLDSYPPRSISRYLSEEILNQQAPDVQDLLERISILERFSVEACAAILGGDASHEWVRTTLEWLERANLILIPLDEYEGWYRLHHLFQQFLRQSLQRHSSAEELATLHRRASAWYAEQGLIEEAIQHALAAGDVAEAAQLVEARFFSALEQEQWGQVERWLRLLPQQHVRSSPLLLLAQVWIDQAHGQMIEIPRLLEAAERLLATGSDGAGEPGNPQTRFLRTLIADLWSWFQYFTGQTQASSKSARSAMAWLPSSGGGYLASLSQQFVALSNQAVGREDVALDSLLKVLREQPVRPNETACLLLAQTLMYLAEGKLHQSEHSAQHLLRLAQRTDLPLSQHWAHWVLGTVAYERNELETAACHFSTLIANRHQAHFWTVRDAMCGLALTYQARGLKQEAQATATTLLEWVQDQHNMGDLMIAYAFRGRLALLQNEVEQAARWLEMAGEQEVLGPMVFLEDPAVTKVRLLLARGDEQSVAHGQEQLAHLLQHVEAMHNTRKLIKVLAFQAWAYDLQKRENEAVEVLERVLALGHADGFVRTFADLPRLSRVLAELRMRRKARQAGDGQLDIYLQNIQVAMNPMLERAVSMKELLRQEGLEPLTDRELEIMRLLERDLTSRDIASELVVSPGTIKVHTANLYRKLGVHNRQAAVTHARALGLLAVI